jgi:hypothetical protein
MDGSAGAPGAGETDLIPEPPSRPAAASPCVRRSRPDIGRRGRQDSRGSIDSAFAKRQMDIPPKPVTRISNL